MSIHGLNQPFVRPSYVPTPWDHKRKHHAPIYQRPIKYFFGGIIGTPEEKKLADLMNRQPQPVKA